jgi:hypothetical protein
MPPRSRIAPLALVVVLVASSAAAQVQTRAQQTCIKRLNKAGATIAGVVNKRVVGCVKAACKSKLPGGTTAEECLLADPHGGLAQAQARAVATQSL